MKKIMTVILMTMAVWLFAVPQGTNETKEEKIKVTVRMSFDMYTDVSEDSSVVEEEMDKMAIEIADAIFLDILKEEMYGLKGKPYEKLIKRIKEVVPKEEDADHISYFFKKGDVMIQYLEFTTGEKMLACIDATNRAEKTILVDFNLDGLVSSQDGLPDMWQFKGFWVMGYKEEGIPERIFEGEGYQQQFFVASDYFLQKLDEE